MKNAKKKKEKNGKEKIDLAMVEHVARLAKIRLTEKEAKKYQKDMNDILKAFGELRKVNANKKPSFHPVDVKDVLRKDEVEKELGYFLNNAPRMRYHWFRQCGLFTGSGVVESSCKTVIGQRLKQSGMHWTLSGADAIIALRCHEASSHWEAVCNTPDTQTRTA